MKKFLLFFSIFLVPAMAAAQNVPAGFDLSNHGVRIEPDKRVMIVLAAIESARTTNAAGEPVRVIDTPLSAEGAKFRDLLTSDLAALDEKLRDRISSFIIRHKASRPNATDADLIAPFITMAYSLGPPPDLADPVITSDLPGSLLDVLDFAPLVRDFYRTSSISGNLNDYIRKYTAAADGQLRGSAREMVTELLGYLRTRPQLYFAERVRVETARKAGSKSRIANIETRERERRFYIVPEMLSPTGTISFVNIKDDYYVVVPPDTDLSFSDVRRAYLQFVIDPIVLNHSRDIATIQDAVKRLLEERRKIDPAISPDVYLTISRSIVAAIDARQLENERIQIATARARQKIDTMKDEGERRAVAAELDTVKRGFTDETALRLSEDYEKGAVLVFYFAEQLKGVEDSGFDIVASMREMILEMDPSKEGNRLEEYAEARKRALAAREKQVSAPTVVIAENPVTTRLLEIQETVEAKNYSRAEADLKQLLEKNPDEPRIFYNIGRVASLSAESLEDQEQLMGKLLEAKVAYENVIRIARKQWSDAAAGVPVKQPIDRALVSLSYVALGKIYEFTDNDGYAMAIYDEAIRIGDIAGGGYGEALAAKQRLLQDQ
jgi:tetratricopeptide (TPR) repeat protein